MTYNVFGGTLNLAQSIRTVQMIAENVYVWLVGLWHPVSER